jgi:hypothetical protein
METCVTNQTTQLCSYVITFYYDVCISVRNAAGARLKMDMSEHPQPVS